MRKLLLGEDDWDVKFIEKERFNKDVLKKALEDINGHWGEPPTQANRNSFVSAGLKYQELIDEENGKYIYHFKVTSSEKTLKLIDPSARSKATATFDALRN